MEKPGYKTSEFWLTIAAFIVSALMASGVAVEGSVLAQVIGFASATLAALGYTAARGFVKGKTAVSEAIKATPPPSGD